MTKRMVLPVLLLVVLLGATAWADTTVTYSTSGSSTTSSNLTFSGYSGSVVVPDGFATYATLGTFTVLGNATINTPFDITITQTQPTVGGPQVFSGTLSGMLLSGGAGSTVTLAFDNHFVQIGDVVYTLATSDLYTISGGASGTQTTIQAAVTVVPEPGSLMLLGSGLLGAGGILRRRLFNK